MNRITQVLMVLLFTLLQCVAPLVHAHIDGNNQHSESIQAASQTGSHSSALFSSAEQPESAAISLDNPFQREISDTLTDHRTIESRIPAPGTPTIIKQFVSIQASFLDAQYFSPPRQAPPL